jgi:hypothetical protein
MMKACEALLACQNTSNTFQRLYLRRLELHFSAQMMSDPSMPLYPV